MSERTLLQRLRSGEDPSTLEGFDFLVLEVAEYPGLDEAGLRRAEQSAERMATKTDCYIRKPGEEQGWASVEEYNACGRHQLELLRSTAAREMFVSLLPASKQRAFRDQRLLATAPRFRMELDRGAIDDGCQTCGDDVPAEDLYVTIWDAEVDDPGNGWHVCLPCMAKSLPIGMPFRSVDNGTEAR